MDLWILKIIIKPKDKLNCGLIKPEQQIPAWAADSSPLLGDELFSWVFMTG